LLPTNSVKRSTQTGSASNGSRVAFNVSVAVTQSSYLLPEHGHDEV